jgi:hypothetical protein
VLTAHQPARADYLPPFGIPHGAASQLQSGIPSLHPSFAFARSIGRLPASVSYLVGGASYPSDRTNGKKHN